MAKMQRRLTLTIQKAPELRPTHDIEFVLPWLKKKSEILNNLDNTVLREIVRRCEHKIVPPNRLLVEQGEIGDSLFIVLSGSVSVYISSGEPTNTLLEGADDEEEKELTPEERFRRSLGKFIIKFESGKCFGEVALINEESVRTASIVTDEVCHFMEVPRDLYNTTLRAYYDVEYAERTEFISKLPLFRDWNEKDKRGLVEAMQKHEFSFETPMMKQGQPWTGLFFIVGGQAKCEMEPTKHEKQYSRFIKRHGEKDFMEMEFQIAKKKKKPIVTEFGGENHEFKEVDQVHVKRAEGYAAAEKRLHDKKVMLCSVEGGDVLGELEGLMNLTTNAYTVTVTSHVTAFLLNPKNFERLVLRRGQQDDAYIQLSDLLTRKVTNRINLAQSDSLALLKAVQSKMCTTPRKIFTRPVVELRDGKHLPSDDVLLNHLMNKFVKSEAELLVPKVRGGIYYRDLAREKARLRNSVDEHNVNQETQALRKMRKVKRIKRAKRPPSLKPRTVKALKKALENVRVEQEKKEKHDFIAEVRKREEEEIKMARERFQKFKRYSMAIVTKNNEKFEPSKLTATMLENHDKMMTKKTQKEIKPVGKEKEPEIHSKQITFITKMRPDIIADDAISTPEAKPSLTEPRKSILKRPSSAPKTHTNSQEETDNPLNLPNIHLGESISRANSSRYSNRSRLVSRELGGSNIDLDIESGILPLLSENPAYRDWETSNTALSYLEEKIKEFSMKNDPDCSRESLSCLPTLVRFQTQDETVEQPRRGGRVSVKTKPCNAANKTRYYMKDHQHSRTSMVSHLDGYEEMRKTRMIRHMILDDERKDWIQEQQKKYKGASKRTSLMI